MKHNRVYLIKNPAGITEEQYNRCLLVLPESRRKKAERYRFYKDRVLSVVAGSLLTYALMESFGLLNLPKMTEGEHGKPVLKDHPEIFFNLSHCQAAVACAVSTGEVGIDVEESKVGIARIAKRYFSERENARIAAEKDQAVREIFYRRIWTLKEAYGKYTGRGLFYDLRGKDFSLLLKNGAAKIPLTDSFKEKEILLLDDMSFSMAVYSDRPMTLIACTIDDLCKMADGCRE